MIVGVCGRAGSGKDTIADILVRNHGFVKVAFADPLKRVCRDIFDFSYEQLWGPSERRNEQDTRYLRKRGRIFSEAVNDFESFSPRDEYLTPRFALQQLGTEWGRNCYSDIWVEYALRVADKLLKKDYVLGEAVWHYDAERGLYRGDPHFSYVDEPRTKVPGGVVISDVRFLNEVDALRKRPDVDLWKVHRSSAGLKGAAALHQSEVELEGIPAEKFTHMIDNNGSLDDLIKSVEETLHWKGLHL